MPAALTDATQRAVVKTAQGNTVLTNAQETTAGNIARRNTVQNRAMGSNAVKAVTEITAPRGAPDTDAGKVATNRNVLLFATLATTKLHYPTQRATAVRIAKGIIVLINAAATIAVRIAQVYSVPNIAMGRTAVGNVLEIIVRLIARPLGRVVREAKE